MDFIDDLDVSIIANILVNMGIDISNLLKLPTPKQGFAP